MSMWRSTCFASFQASCLIFYWIHSNSTTAENYKIYSLMVDYSFFIHFCRSLHLLRCPIFSVSFASKQFYISYHTSLTFSESYYEIHYNASITWSSSNFERCFQMVAYSNFRISFLSDNNSFRSPHLVQVAFIYFISTVQILSRSPIM